MKWTDGDLPSISNSSSLDIGTILRTHSMQAHVQYITYIALYLFLQML